MTDHIVRPHSLRLGGKLFQICRPAVRPIDNECSSVGRTQLSDMGIGNKLTVIGQVTRGIAGQGPVDESRNLEHDTLLHRKPVQLVEHMRDMIMSLVAVF